MQDLGSLEPPTERKDYTYLINNIGERSSRITEKWVLMELQQEPPTMTWSLGY